MQQLSFLISLGLFAKDGRASTFSISPTHRSQTLPARIATNCRQSLGKTYVMAGMVGFADYEAESNSNFQISRLRFFGISMSMPSMTGSGPYSQELTSADFLLGRTGHRVQPGPAGSIGFCSFPSRLQSPTKSIKLHPSVPAFDKPSASGSRDFPAGFGQHGTLAEKKNAAFSVLSKTWLCLN